MAGPTRISELSDGSPVQPTDQVPVARGSGVTGYTYKVNAGRFVSDLFNVGNSSTVDLTFNTSTRTLCAAANPEASLFNVANRVRTGTTAQRPFPAIIGDLFYNTTLSIFEWYDGVQWMTSEAQRRSDQVIQTFTSSGTFTVPAGITNISEILVVAGGGGAGGTYGGGGGAGGVLYSTNLIVTPGSSIVVTIGAGGIGGRGSSNSPYIEATNGQNSAFGSLIAIGGGRGSQYNAPLTPSGSPGSGGSGGGAYGATTPAGTGTAGQGFAGGAGDTNMGGAGGGAGEPGFRSFYNGGTANTIGGNGGRGIPNPISGSTAGQLVGGVYYVGGGGGAGGAAVIGLGGLGGGGNGVTSGNGNNGTANTGGGGGSSVNDGYATVKGGDGGSGVVVIKY